MAANHLTLAQRQAYGRQAGKANAICCQWDVIERYAHLERNEAIWQAWKDSRKLARWQRYRARKAHYGRSGR